MTNVTQQILEMEIERVSKVISALEIRRGNLITHPILMDIEAETYETIREAMEENKQLVHKHDDSNYDNFLCAVFRVKGDEDIFTCTGCPFAKGEKSGCEDQLGEDMRHFIKYLKSGDNLDRDVIKTFQEKVLKTLKKLRSAKSDK